MGAITVAAGTPRGTYRLQVIEPAGNAGTFAVFGPRHNPGPWIGNVAAAFSGGGLSFTLADGGNDFVAGDGFTIVVGGANENINTLEVKRNELTWWQMDDIQAARYAARYGRVPLSQTYVVDLIADGYGHTVMPLAGTRSFDVKANVTAAETLTLINQVIAPVFSN
jgi:hypothetical protein